MNDAIHRQLHLLLGAYGYNLYNQRNRARADDLLVRQKAAAALAEAAGALRQLRTDYARRYIPTATREQPDPPREALARLSDIAHTQERCAELESRIRGMPVPVQDAVWERFRKEERQVNDLLVRDYDLILPCLELRDRLLPLTAEAWGDELTTELQTSLNRIEQAIRSRSDLLQIPGW